jgi:hypothetical protein
MKNVNKNKYKIGRLAVRLLEKHLKCGTVQKSNLNAGD